MNIKEAVKAMLKYRHKTQMELASDLGLGSQSTIGNALGRGNMTVETLVKYCDACGFEVVIQPTNVRGKRPEGQFVIDDTSANIKKRGDSE